MKKLILLLSAVSAITLHTSAQTKNLPSGFVSGDYEDVKIAVDSVSNSFSGVVESKRGMFSCALFFVGKMTKGNDGKFAIQAFPFGEMETTPVTGTLLFKNGKNGHGGWVTIQVKETGACQNMMDFKSGDIVQLDTPQPYHAFGMVKVKKAMLYAESIEASIKKAYFVQGNFVNILSEEGGFYFVSYTKKPTYNAWIKKSDIIIN